MKKDVIYIDVEDDITAIIEKIKLSKAGIVALVPPRRLGVLQSIVNLKLLKRAGDESGNKLVLITSDRALMAITAGIGIPVARNLQSRPELVPEASDADDVTEVIEGELPNGQDANPTLAPVATAAKKTPSPTVPPRKTGGGGKRFKVPNFNNFRKKALIIGGVVVFLVAFLVWAIMYAPKGQVVIKAETDKADISMTATINPDAEKTDSAQAIIKPIVQQKQEDLTLKITPTGKKDIGEKASGSITVKNCDDTEAQSLASGSQFIADNGLVYVSTQGVVVPGFKGSSSSCNSAGTGAGKVSVPVQAKEIGEQYNVAAQSYTIPGVPNWSASGSAMSGGSKRNVTVVTQSDVDKAKQQLLEKNLDEVKKSLAGEFDKNMRVIDESFTSQAGTATSQPGVDQEASEATVKLPMTYSLVGISNDDLSNVLNANVETKIDNKQAQKIYDNGYGQVKLVISDKPDATHMAVALTTSARIGPNIDTAALAKQLSGKRYGEIEAIVTKLPGVKTVETKFSPFWVTKAPKAEKLTIKLQVADGS